MGVVLAWATLWQWAGGLTAAVVVCDRRPERARGVHPEGLRQHLPALSWVVRWWGSSPACCSRWPHSATAPAGRGSRSGSASGSPGCGRGCSRCWRWSSDGHPIWALTGWSSGVSPGSRRCACADSSRQDSREPVGPLGDRDLAQLLSGLQTHAVHVAVQDPAVLPAETATEVQAAVEACLGSVSATTWAGRPRRGCCSRTWASTRWCWSPRRGSGHPPPGGWSQSAAEGRLGVRRVHRGPAARAWAAARNRALGARTGHRVGALGAPRRRPPGHP